LPGSADINLDAGKTRTPLERVPLWLILVVPDDAKDGLTVLLLFHFLDVPIGREQFYDLEDVGGRSFKLLSQLGKEETTTTCLFEKGDCVSFHLIKK
jgi:hypothetical protein